MNTNATNTTDDTNDTDDTDKTPTHLRFAAEMDRLAERMSAPDQSKTGYRRRIGWKLPYWLDNEVDELIAEKLRDAHARQLRAADDLQEIAAILRSLPADYSDRRGSGPAKPDIDKGSVVRIRADKVSNYVGLLFAADDTPLTAEELAELRWTVVAVRKTKLAVKCDLGHFLPNKADFELAD